mgnify:CR=1 FL=1
MTRTEFSAWCRSVRLLDGATGSMLRTAGMPAGVCSESWILSHPQPLLDLQRAYLSASSEVIYAPTFGANRVLLGHHDLQNEVSALNRDLVQLSREAVGTNALLAGDMTTTGQPVLSGDDSAYAALLDIYREQAEALLHAGIDLFAVETMMGVTECMAAVEAIRSLCDVPILCTLSVYSDGKCYFDGSAEEAAEVFHRLTRQSDAYAIIYVTETYAEALHAQIEKYASSVTPAVILIPGAGGCKGLGMNALNAAVERAVGSNIL